MRGVEAEGVKEEEGEMEKGREGGRGGGVHEQRLRSRALSFTSEQPSVAETSRLSVRGRRPVQITHWRQRRPQPEQIVAGECCEGWELLAAPFIVCVCQCVLAVVSGSAERGGGCSGVGGGMRRPNQM